MMRLLPFLFAILAALSGPAAAQAEGVVAAHMISVGTVIGPSDLRLAEKVPAGTLTDPDQAIGLETRRTIYAGRPVRAGDLQAPALVERNDLVRVVYTKGALEIVTEGRALDRGAAGDRVSVMNLMSRTVIYGQVVGPGLVQVMR